ncbi:aldehyde dehydrogenase family protein [Kordiimonas aquimaris]|uniref:aldehyde dehydrogenase family protein n=1 Tax=Kordiimonas aquimaris TaxID=707591 RepID=UPI0021CFB156|nr:aldehyde dehydrogenase family protein [Kordiimonas aquimaris]
MTQHFFTGQNPNITTETKAFVTRYHGLFIDGQTMPAASGETFDVFEPSTGHWLTSIAAANSEDVNRAVQSSRNAFDTGPWPRMTPAERELILFRLADLIEQNKQLIAEIETLDMGKPVIEARDIDVMESASYCRYMAGWATKLDGRVTQLSAGPGNFGYTRKEPIGVVGAIIPWNFPFSMACWKVIAALAAGCTVVLKPSELASLTSLKLAELAIEAGVPTGVLNVITGDGQNAGAPLMAHPSINKASFTGSTAVGKMIGKAAMENLTRVTLELGGKSPMIVLGDADPASIAEELAAGIFFNAGQVCTAGSRLLVQEKIYEDVLLELTKVANNLVVGAGLDESTQMGPLASLAHKEKVESYINLGREEGARLITSNRDMDENGYYVSPTIFADCTDTMRIVTEEIFGPVLVASSFKDIDEVVSRVNNSSFGLAASIWSNDLKKVMDITPRIQAGIVWVNTHNPIDASLPFGGFKHSGIGRENGPEQIEAYLETKSVWINHADS